MNKLSDVMGYGDVERIKKDVHIDIDGEEKEKEKDKYESVAHRDGLKMHYKSGPVKQYDRSREKVESDYSTSKYPQSQRLIDLCRCSITVDTVEELLSLLQSIIQIYSKEKKHFIRPEKITDTDGSAVQLDVTPPQYPSESGIIGIARVKNGFQGLRLEDIKKAEIMKYHDIKVNVVFFDHKIKQSIIVEVFICFFHSQTHFLFVTGIFFVTFDLLENV